MVEAGKGRMSVEWRLMPTMRVAAFSHLNRDGHEIMVESDAKTKLCCHGETSSTIRNWVLAESKARAAGTPPPPRNSVCDCQQTVGLALCERGDAKLMRPT